MKTLLKIIGVLLVLVIAAVLYLASNADEIVKRVIESVGTETLATEVTVGGVSVELSGEAGATVTDLRVANAPGFKQPYAFELGLVSASVNTASLSRDVLVIPGVTVEQARVTFEQEGNRINLQTLLDNIESDDEASDPESAEEGADTLLAIKQLRLSGVGVTAYSDQLPQPFEFVLGDIVVNDVGTPEAGVTSDEAAEVVMEKVLEEATAEAKRRVRDEIEKQVRAEIERKATEATEDLKKSLRDKLRGD